MLDSKSRNQAQKAKRHHLHSVPAGIYRSDTCLISLLPQSSKVGGRSARVAVNQISRPYRSVEICGAWQMRSLVSGCEDRSISTGRNGRPGREPLSTRGNRECVFCVDHLDCIPRDVMGTKNIDNSHPTIINFNPWSPIQIGNQCDDKSNAWSGDGKHPKSLANPNANQNCKKNDRNHDRNDLSKSGFKNLHHTNVSLGAIA